DDRSRRPGALGLDDRRLREEPAAGARRLAPRERDQLTLRAAGDTERDGGDAEGQEAEDGKGVERPAEARPVGQERERAGGGHEAILDRDVVAARAAQPGHVPGVDDTDRSTGKEHEAVVGRAARKEPGLPAVEHDAAAHEPAAVLAAARARPAAGHAVT